MANKDRLGIFESRVSLATFAWQAVLAVTSFALPAWAARAVNLFAEYSPLSWVASGFLGLLVASAAYALYAWAKAKRVRSKYDANLLASGGSIDPLAKTFEGKRINLNDFVLPSNPYINGKTFIDCEIVGPANIVLYAGNSVADHRLPICDAMVLADGSDPHNGYVFTNCVFRGCSFIRITLMLTLGEYEAAKEVNWLRWITIRPEAQGEFDLTPQAEGSEPLSLPEPEEETQH